MKSFLQTPLPFGVSAVNYVLSGWTWLSLPAPFQMCCYLKNKFSKILPKTQALRSATSILVAPSLLFPESAKIYSYKFQTKFWINKSLLYLDYSPYIVFLFKIDVRNNFITYSLIQQIFKYHYEIGSNIMVKNWKDY